MSDRFHTGGVRSWRGRLRVPGDKSISHRALIFAAVAEGRSVLANLGTGDDVARTRAAVETLGVRVKAAGGQLRLVGGGWDALREPERVIDCGNSGTSIRTLCGLLAGRPMHSVLMGDSSVSQRPMLRVVDPLRAMGARIDGRAGGQHPPLAIRGGHLQGTQHRTEVASAQVKTALVLAGLQADGRTEVMEPAPSRDHTERMLSWLDVPIDYGPGRVAVEAATIPGFDLEIPGDPSAAAFFLVGALISPESEVSVEGVCLNPGRLAFIDVLRRMGASIEVVETGPRGGEPVGDITARTSALQGTRIGGEELPLVQDEIPVLAVAAAFAEGETSVDDAAELRVKETDRIGAVEQELSQMGVGVETRRDGLTVRGGHPRAGTFKSHGDHRIAMAMAVAASACDGESEIGGWGAVATSYPDFAQHLALATGGTG